VSLKLLPWDYGVRNLIRRPFRSGLTMLAMTTVVLLVFVVVAFIRGLEVSLAISGDPQVVLVSSPASEQNIEQSSIAARTPGLLAASIEGTERRFGVSCVSPEVFLGTRISVGAHGNNDSGAMGLIRGVTLTAPLVRRRVRLVDGHWPGPGEVIVGRLAAAKLGCREADLALGREIGMDGKRWKIAGHFAAQGSTFESELWCRLADLQQALKRQDLTLVAVLLAPGHSASEIELFCKERVDLELQAVSERDYYASLQKFYRPIRWLAWAVVWLVIGSGVFAGFNAMYGAVAGRTRELASLQAIGFRRRAILLSLLQESTVLGTSASLVASVLAFSLLNGIAIRFTMGAFSLLLDEVAVLVALSVGLLLGVVGAIPGAIRALRMPVVESLKAT
jgi:ABC-type lipoprotein release transport system permease subunit